MSSRAIFFDQVLGFHKLRRILHTLRRERSNAGSAFEEAELIKTHILKCNSITISPNRVDNDTNDAFVALGICLRQCLGLKRRRERAYLSLAIAKYMIDRFNIASSNEQAFNCTESEGSVSIRVINVLLFRK
jgi:hypothetical protein